MKHVLLVVIVVLVMNVLGCSNMVSDLKVDDERGVIIYFDDRGHVIGAQKYDKELNCMVGLK